MCDEFIHQGLVEDTGMSRRTFGLVAFSVAGAAQATALTPTAVDEKDVLIQTKDGTADAVLFTPRKSATFPAVLMWPDIMGLRPTFRDMGRRLATEGYVVLVPNPFYRSKKAPVLEGTINFGDPATREVLTGYRKAMTDVASDASAYIGFLDSQPKTSKRRRAGVQGYCMGGGLSFQTAAAVPNRIGAIGSFHGGNGLLTKDANSPHLLIPRTNPGSTWLVLQAQNDDAQQPQVKEDLRAAFAAAKLKAR